MLQGLVVEEGLLQMPLMIFLEIYSEISLEAEIHFLDLDVLIEVRISSSL